MHVSAKEDRCVGVFESVCVGCGAIVECPGMHGVLVWFGVAGGKPRLQGFRIRLWVLVGR